MNYSSLSILTVELHSFVLSLLYLTFPWNETFSVYRAESQSLHHWSAKYCPLLPPPRSTIAAAFSPDGKTLASTQ